MPIPISLLSVASYMPQTVVPNSFFETDDSGHRMFKGAVLRRHVAPDESTVDMMERACLRLGSQLNLNFARDVDILLTSVSVLDMPFTGMGAGLAYRLGASTKWVMDIHNGGCVSFIFMMEVARALMQSSGAKTAMICNVSNAGGRVFNHPLNRKVAQSSIPGDGCGVGYLVANDASPVKSVFWKCYGEYAADMRAVSDDGNPWWAPRTTPLHIEFTEKKLASIVGRANKIVPHAMYEAMALAGLQHQQIDKLITNQPHPIFMRNWRESIMLEEKNHLHTFSEYGNLFGAGIPVSLADALDKKRVQDGEHLLFGGFAHAGDYAGAAVVHWHAGATRSS